MSSKPGNVTTVYVSAGSSSTKAPYVKSSSSGVLLPVNKAELFTDKSNSLPHSPKTFSTCAGNQQPQILQIGNTKLMITVKDCKEGTSSKFGAEGEFGGVVTQAKMVHQGSSGELRAMNEKPSVRSEDDKSSQIPASDVLRNMKKFESLKGAVRNGKNDNQPVRVPNSSNKSTASKNQGEEDMYIKVICPDTNIKAKTQKTESVLEETKKVHKFRRRTVRKAAVERQPDPLPQLQPNSKQLTLKEVANSLSINLPQLAEVKKGYTCPIAGSVTQGEVLLLVDRKKVTAVKGVCTWNGQPICLLQSSKFTLSPVSSELAADDMISVEDLLSCKQLPPVVRVMESFTASKGHTVSKGALLYFDKDAKQQSLFSSKVALKAKYTSSQKSVTLPSSGKKTFSINPRDVQVYLFEVISLLQYPMALQVNLKPLPRIVTVQNVCQQDVLVAQRFDVSQGRPKQDFVEMPVTWDVTLVTVSIQAETQLHTKETLYSSIDELEEEEDIEYSYVESNKTVTKFNSLSTLSPQQSLGDTAELSIEARADNVAFLKKLGTDGIQMMLDVLKMHQYKELFRDEGIDGEILSSLTEQDLLEELDIIRRLDRVRLMKVIEGKYSVKKMLSQLYI